MANQNAVENSLATEGSEQSEVNDTTESTEVESDTVESDTVESAPESAPEPQQSAPVQAPARAQGELVDALTSSESDAERKEVPEGRPYEIVFIVRNTHGNDIQSITDRAKALIEGPGGAVDNVRTSDVRRFSYPIRKEVEGSYVVLNARFVTPTVIDLDRFFKLEEGILRHLIVREDV